MLFWAFMIVALGVGMFLDIPSKQLAGAILVAAGTGGVLAVVLNNRKHRGKHGIFGACWCRPTWDEPRHQESQGSPSSKS
ncbi:MAG: hypothetical protein FJ317_01955 [SAR202 cluster bacterium]|nr:hypothetical protein [SAR202 cluster bacterium]